MMRAMVLAWWFAFAGHFDQSPATFGPFVDKPQCEQLRTWLQTNGHALSSRVSWCWWDGKS